MLNQNIFSLLIRKEGRRMQWFACSIIQYWVVLFLVSFQQVSKHYCTSTVILANCQLSCLDCRVGKLLVHSLMAYKGQRAPTSCDNGNEHSLPWYHPTFIVTAAFSTYMLVFMMASKIDSMRNPKGGKKYCLTGNQASRVIAVFVIYSMFPLSHLCMLALPYFLFGIYKNWFEIIWNFWIQV